MNDAREICCDVLVVGGGPAGIAAAVTAAEAGAAVALLDDNPSLGGQIWHGHQDMPHATAAKQWFARLERANVNTFSGARAFHAETGLLFAETRDVVYRIEHEKLIVATGARERFIPFPGWTLPNVFGAGALQALIKSGLPIEGKRIVVAGTGPLLFAVADCARRHGAVVLCIAEQSSWAQYVEFALRLLATSQKNLEALGLVWNLRSISHWKNSWPVEATGKDVLETVRVIHGGRVEEIACDYLACGFHLVPNTELAEYLGCELNHGFVVVGADQQTSLPGTYCAGEPTGIGGVEAALAQGELAGWAAATNQTTVPVELRRKRMRAQRAIRILERGTRLREELRRLPAPDTFICRCEDVRFAELAAWDSGASAKLQTRCGMGACQGKVCGPALEFLFRWKLNRQRSPIFPVRCASLAAIGGVRK